MTDENPSVPAGDKCIDCGEAAECILTIDGGDAHLCLSCAEWWRHHATPLEVGEAP